jgi:hypothetical protein
MHTARWIAHAVLSLLCLALLCGCAAAPPAPADDALAEARAALSRGEAERAVELAAPHAGAGGEAALLLARARAAQARVWLARAPKDSGVRRAALDQVSLALPLAAADPALHAELRAMSDELVELLSAPELLAAQATPAPTASPGPDVEPPAITPPPLPTAAAPPPAAAARPQARPTARPAPSPPTPSYTVARRQSFEGSGNSGGFASCVDVQVLGPGGPVAGAVIGINNGEHSYQNQTDAGGYAGRCGLGASTWSVVLFWTPGEGEVRGAVTTVALSGAPEQRGIVVFQR